MIDTRFRVLKTTDADPYAFISYTHSDAAKVNYILRILHNNHKRFWYDDGIDHGDNWKETVDNYLDNSSMFMLFMSNGIQLRPEVNREIRRAINKHKNDRNYKIFVVLLERVPIRHIYDNDEFRDIYDVLQEIQYISVYKYGGITSRFQEAILSNSVWTNCATESEKNQMKEGKTEIVLDLFDDTSSKSGYIYPYAFPESSGLGDFYQLNVGDTDPNAVYPVCVDNQWIPYYLMVKKEFIENGFNDIEITKERNRKQQYEIISALLHNWQVIINRASIYNTKAISEWFVQNDSVAEAFGKLIENGSIVVYLMKEEKPDSQPSFDVDKIAFKAWRRFCLKHKVFCIRLSWDETTNAFEISKRIETHMMKMLITTANDPYRLDELRKALKIKSTEKDSFNAMWRKIRDITLANDDFKSGSYTRDTFYKDFLIKRDTAVTDCILEYSKPFVSELKQVIDYCYVTNLPAALHIKPFTRDNDSFWNYSMNERKSSEDMRLISIDELTCSILNYSPTIISKKTYNADMASISLEEVVKIRSMAEWIDYMQTLDSCRKRANLNEVDFYDVELIWEKFSKLLEKCRSELNNRNWVETKACFSVIYCINNTHITAVYKADSVIIKKESFESMTDRLKSNLAIDFMFGDVTDSTYTENCLYEKLRLFDGILMESEKLSYQRLIKCLNSLIKEKRREHLK